MKLLEGQKRLTLEDVMRMDCPTLTPNQVAGILNADPNTIRWQAHENPAGLGFPVIVAKRRTYIPRLPFIRFMTGLTD